jgi:hypothetical protein
MRLPLGKRGVVGIGAALTGALVFLRIRSRKRDQEAREWESEIAGAVDEGRAASEANASTAPSDVTISS